MGKEWQPANLMHLTFCLIPLLASMSCIILKSTPFSLENFQLSDYFTLSVHYADTTGEAHYEDTSNYLIVETESAWYLIEIGPNSVIEKILEEGQITSRDDVLVYEISEDAYSELANLFDRTT